MRFVLDLPPTILRPGCVTLPRYGLWIPLPHLLRFLTLLCLTLLERFYVSYPFYKTRSISPLFLLVKTVALSLFFRFRTIDNVLDVDNATLSPG